MRKCGFILLLHALLLLMCVPSWGEGFNISSMTTAYKTVYSVDVKANYRANIIIRTNVQYYGNDVTADYYATNVGSIKWTVMNSDGALTDCKLVQSDDETTEVDNDDIADLKEDKTYRFRLTGNIAKAGKVTVIATLKAGKDSPLVYGQYGIPEQSIDITFSATSKDASGNVITSDETGDNAPTEDIDASSIAPDTDTLDPRDPDSRKWNGLLPPFTFTPGTVAAGVKPKVTWTKPEDFEAGTSTDTVVATITGPVTGVNVYIADKDATKLFGVNLAKGETIGDIPLTKANIKAYNIPFRVTSVDASKNTASNDKKKDKEAVTTVTVAFNGGNFEYKGFPITVSAWNSNNSDKPAAKTVKLTVTPNESTPEWGSGYIGTRTTRVGGTLVTTTTTGKVSTPYSTSSYSTWINWQTQGNSAYKGGTGITLTPSVGYTYNYNNTLKNSGGNPLEVKYHFEDGKRVRYEYNSTNINAGIYPAYNIYNNTSFGTENYNAWAYNSSYSVEQRGKYWNAVIPTTFILTVSQQGPQTSSEYVGATYKTVPYVSFTSVDLKEKHEIVVGIYPDKEAGEQGGSVPTTTYNVLAPAPYIITAKAPKEDTGIYVSITQPVFDYLGEVTRLGAVTIGGTLAKTDKESKNAITLTATNPLTKKKAALKTTVISKTPPSFSKLQDFTFDTSILGDTDTDEAFTESYGYADTRKKLKTKRVIMPKLPKAKFGAKGSKTITYKLGLYDDDGDADWMTAYSYTRSKFTEDAELWDYMYGYVVTHALASGYGEQFNEELEANLLAHNMSFDAKKGQIVLLEKGAKTTPTLNEDGDKFASLDLAITAVNEVGAAQAWADLPVTGEKPKVADKSLVLSGKVQKGSVFTFKLLGGKTAAEGVKAEGGSINVRSYTAKEADTKVLSDWGLELVNYDSMDILVSDELTFDAGETIPAYSTARAKIVDTGDYSSPGSAVVSTTTDGVTTYTAGSYGATLLSGDTWVRSKDINYINHGLIQVVDPNKLAQVVQKAAAADTKGKASKKLQKGSKVSLLLDNLGTPGKGKITVCLESDITSAGDPANYNPASLKNNSALPAVNKAAPRTAGYVQNHGTALDAETDSESEEAESVTVGAPRTAADLTAGQKAFLAEKGYTVIAVLPEISANADGQQDFDVELDEDSPEGAKLVYIPFPKNAQETDDDSIADFYDAEGQAIEEVPAEKDIVVSPWLREGVTYEPVIAVENAGLTF